MKGSAPQWSRWKWLGTVQEKPGQGQVEDEQRADSDECDSNEPDDDAIQKVRQAAVLRDVGKIREASLRRENRSELNSITSLP